MTFRLALRVLLPLLAVVSLALTPVTASAAAAGMFASMTAQAHGPTPAMDHGAMDMAGTDVDDMPCCPPEKGEKPDCAKAGCPLLALCLTHVASVMPATIPVPAPVATRTSRAWPDVASFASVHGPPLPEPPRS